tara:strand:- start:640 stop:1158 length:519 start_codon:yes stop_codon:yes gene_type:complete
MIIKNLSACCRILASLMTGFLLGLSIKTIYNLTAKQPCYWKDDPILINCAGEDINEETIQRAVKFWKEKGEHIYFYEYKGIESVCKNVKPLDGFIIINTHTTEALEENVLAVTKRRSKLGIMQSAVITFKPGRHNIILLLEHELGHAFGYSHRKIPGHVMHPYYDMMGDKFW